MTEENNIPDELTTLKARADKMDIKYHPKIGVDKLREKVNKELADPEASTSSETAKPTEKTTKVSPVKDDKKYYLTAEEYGVKNKKSKRLAASRLVRVRITCMNPNKTELEGEIISVGSARLGTHKKYILFNTEDGYHIPEIIYNHLKQSKCTIFHTVKDRRGMKVRKGKLVPEYAIEVLDPLTPEEIKNLALRQARTGNINEE